MAPRISYFLAGFLVAAGTAATPEKTGAQSARGAIDSVGRGLLKAASPDDAPFRQFGSNLLAHLVRTAPAESSAVISPVSAAIALALVLEGARGETATQMARALEPRPTRGGAAKRAAELVSMARDRKDVTLDIANAIWVDPRVTLDRDFEMVARTVHRAVVREVALASQSATVQINRWADSATRGKIKRILDKPLPDNAALFVANAVYFKGLWLAPFDTARTRDRDFRTASGALVRVRMMERTGNYAYRRGAGYQVARLPYRGGRTAMYVVLPDSGVAIGALANRLARGDSIASLGPADMRDVRVVVPRFKVEQTIDLKPLLTDVGMGIAFDENRADLSGLGRSHGRLYIDRAVQRVFIEVNEEGTEAAAVTGMAIGVTSLRPPPVPFVVDRPFLFILRDEVSGAELFVGRVSDPR